MDPLIRPAEFSLEWWENEQYYLQSKEEILRKKEAILQRYGNLPIEIENQKKKELKPLSSLGRLSRGDVITIENNLNLSKPNDVVTLVEKYLESFPRPPYSATFSTSCLEHNLAHRWTSMMLNNDNNVKILLSVSGAGKTRCLLELLYHRFGYYFVCGQGMSDFGSADMSTCKDFAYRYPDGAKYFIRLLYFVRVCVCNYLIRIGFDTPDKILVAQLHPRQFFGTDVFDRIFGALCEMNYREIACEITDSFEFVAIDEIQACLEVPYYDKASGARPFFIPLVFESKLIGRFETLALSGTGINFSLIDELMLSQSFKDLQIKVEFMELRPLDQSQITHFCTKVLTDRGVNSTEIDVVVREVKNFTLCHGRARFLAFLIDKYSESKDIKQAISAFVKVLTNLSSPMFPLWYYFDDVQLHNQGGDVVGLDAINRVFLDGTISFLKSGYACLDARDQLAADAIFYGVGFATILNGAIQGSVSSAKLSIFECLRSIIPFSDVVYGLCKQMKTCGNAQMVGYILDYLVAFVLIANLNQGEESVMRNIKPATNFECYFDTPLDKRNEVFFPDHFCGPAIIYRHHKTVHVVQVNFGNQISKQERMNACHTTDVEYFYWSKDKSHPLEQFNEERANLQDSLVGYELKRYVFVHSSTELTAGVEVIDQNSHPDIFNLLNPEIWELLNFIRQKF
ncbi:hypothetical protein HK098_003059 [Nowakowskiella sp. JEL0407]|nr:hypothetical protein HK098_003059 [Nowakowskiella sp. JEL0407]